MKQTRFHLSGDNWRKLIYLCYLFFSWCPLLQINSASNGDRKMKFALLDGEDNGEDNGVRFVAISKYLLGRVHFSLEWSHFKQFTLVDEQPHSTVVKDIAKTRHRSWADGTIKSTQIFNQSGYRVLWNEPNLGMCFENLVVAHPLLASKMVQTCVNHTKPS